MKLASADGLASIELSPVAYEFATADSSDWFDRNWLIVDGRVVDGDRSWRFRDPCLLTNEWEALADWLRGIAIGRTPKPLEFLEPNLRFELPEANRETVRLAIDLSAEAAAPTDLRVRGNVPRLVLLLSRESLRLAAEQAREERERFPQRP